MPNNDHIDQLAPITSTLSKPAETTPETTPALTPDQPQYYDNEEREYPVKINDFKAALSMADKDGELTKTLRQLDFDDLLKFAKKHVEESGHGILPQIKARIREMMIIKLRYDDQLSFAEIAKHPLVSMNEQAVRNAFYRVLNRFIPPELVEQHIARSLERIDTVNTLAMDLYDRKRPVAATMALNTILSAENRRAKLLGLDAPRRIEVNNPKSTTVFNHLKSAKPIDVHQLKAIQQLDPIMKPQEGAAIDLESVLPEGDTYRREQERDQRTIDASSVDVTVIDTYENNHKEIEAENNLRKQPQKGIFKAA